MALSLDDRLLGEKVHNYCSSSEDDDEEETESGNDSCSEGATSASATELPQPVMSEYQGRSTNTGPKGVLQDWRRFKQLESEKRVDQERERLDLAKRLTLTGKTNEEEEREKQEDQDLMDSLESLEEEFLKEYRRKRMAEMRSAYHNTPTFGQVYRLSKQEYAESIDKEEASVTIVVHLFEEHIGACKLMNECLKCLATQYPSVKFCKITASEAMLSRNFAKGAVPALLVYKGGDLIGNFIRLLDEFGQEFYAGDVEGFLVEHGMLPDKTLMPQIKATEARFLQQEDSGSDFDVD